MHPTCTTQLTDDKGTFAIIQDGVFSDVERPDDYFDSEESEGVELISTDMFGASRKRRVGNDD